MRKRRSTITANPEDELIRLCKEWNQAFEAGEYEKALRIREKAEPIFLSNRNLIKASAPKQHLRPWCWFLVFIRIECREYLIDCVENGIKPEYSKLYLPFMRHEYCVKFY